MVSSSSGVNGQARRSTSRCTMSEMLVAERASLSAPLSSACILRFACVSRAGLESIGSGAWHLSALSAPLRRARL
jgi:hypothetical protein